VIGTSFVAEAGQEYLEVFLETVFFRNLVQDIRGIKFPAW